MIEIKKMSGIRVLCRLLKYSWMASPLTFLALITTSLAVSSLGFLEIISIESLFDSAALAAGGAGIALLYKPLLVLLGILAITPVAEWLEYIVQGYFWRRGSGYMKSLYHGRVGQMGSIEFEDVRNLNELQKANSGSEDAPSALRAFVQIIFLYVPYTLFLLSYLVYVKPMLSLVVVLIFFPTLFAELLRMKQNFDFEDQIAGRRRKTQYFESCMVSKEYFKETRLNGALPYFFQLFTESSQEFGKAITSLKKRILKISALMKLLNAAGFFGVLALLVYYVYTGAISIGLFAAVYYSINKITSMMKRAIEDIGEAMVGISNTSFLVRLLNDDGPILKEDAVSKSCDIHLRDVCFSYPNCDKETLKHINLTIKDKSSIAIVGENGSGKSTLTKLIMGLYEPTRGTILYGDKPLNQYSKASRFARTSAVFQNFMKYKLSVKDNVTIGNISSQDHIGEVLTKADVDLSDLNIAPDTILSREFGGIDLSGGEWQRLAIARGLFRPHDLIVLDEPTAAIDPIEEANVFQSFQRISQGVTSIFVTHRLGSTQIADLILVMDRGAIAERGTHKELMEQKGIYYQLYMSQAQWYER